MRKGHIRLFVLCLIAMAVAGGGARATTSFEGIFQYVHGDSPDFASPGRHAYMLTTPDGTTHDVAPLPEAFDVRPDDLQGETVHIQGYRDPKGTIHASDVSPAQQGFRPDDAPITGSTPWAVLLCKYSNIAAETNPLSYYTGLMDNNFPRLDHYWRAQSYNAINLTGTQAHGWFTLPQPESYYTNPANTDSTNLTNLAQDCTNAANPSVNFAPMTGIIVMVNGAVTGGAGGWGGGRNLTLDGVTKVWPFAWMPSTGHWSGVVAHEMGHGYGLPHSSAQPYPSGGDYQSDWDVMSSGFWNTGAPAPYTSAGTGTIAYHKDKLGWVSASRKFTPASGTATTITLWALGDAAPPASQHLMAQIPIGATSRFYTVEARRKRPAPNYDGGVPADGVVIHEVDTTRSADALVVDPDGIYNQFPDPGEIWLPGETFVDAANGVSVEILTSNADGSFNVRIGLNVAGVTAQHTGGSTQVTEGGASDTYTVVLNSQPTATVTVTPTHTGGQISLSGALTFTSANWNMPQSVTVTAIDDASPEPSPMTAVVTHNASSADPLYNGTGLAPLNVSVFDNDPAASVSPGSIAFGSVQVGSQSPTQTVTVTNSGSGTLALGTVTLTGAHPSDFIKVSDLCSNTSKAAGQSCTIGVAFKPSATGSRSAALSIPHNAAGSPGMVSLSGSGVQTPNISLNRTSINFGNVEMGTTSPAQSVIATNTGGAPLTFGTVVINGAFDSAFIKSSDTCSNTSINPGVTCTITVSFRPGAVGGHNASLSIPNNVPGSPHQVALSGAGVDSIGPSSSISTQAGSIKVAGVDRIEGSTLDSGSGVSRVTVFFTDSLGRTTQTLASLSCNAAKTSCTWSAGIALLLTPGIYSVNVRATDVAGNVEAPGPTISIMVL